MWDELARMRGPGQGSEVVVPDYREARELGRSQVRAGRLIQAASLYMGGLVAVFAVIRGSDFLPWIFFMVPGVLFGAAGLYGAGRVISALGQLLLAQLDTASNTAELVGLERRRLQLGATESTSHG
jgi:hypothetical protein